MINLLKFRELSLDGDGTGAEAYARYGELATPFVERLVGDTHYDWDSVLLVSWPTRQNLIDLGNDEGYQAIAHHRKNALERTMLIALDEQKSDQ